MISNRHISNRPINEWLYYKQMLGKNEQRKALKLEKRLVQMRKYTYFPK